MDRLAVARLLFGYSPKDSWQYFVLISTGERGTAHPAALQGLSLINYFNTRRCLTRPTQCSTLYAFYHVFYGAAVKSARRVQRAHAHATVA